MDWGKVWLVDFNAGKTQLVSSDRSNNNGLLLTFSSKLDWDSYMISIAKTASKKSGALIFYMKFLSPEVAVYLCKSTIRPCVE